MEDAEVSLSVGHSPLLSTPDFRVRSAFASTSLLSVSFNLMVKVTVQSNVCVQVLQSVACS